MIKNKVEFDRLEKEKQELMAQLTFRIDAVNKTSTSSKWHVRKLSVTWVNPYAAGG